MKITFTGKRNDKDDTRLEEMVDRPTSSNAVKSMRIRVASKEDKQVWDSFVNTQNGSFNYYFDFRYLNKSTIQLIIENDRSQLVGICPFEREKRVLYSTIRMRGILFRKDEPEDEIYRATLEVLEYIEKYYSERCSTFIVTEETKLGSAVKANINNAFIDYRFRLKQGLTPDLPCSHVLPLKAPFEEYIWKGLWSQKFRQALRKVDKMGVRVIQDRELKYLENFIEMQAANYKRHGEVPPNRDRIIAECNMFFKDKIKLFVALLNDKPVVIVKCNYTPSTCYLSRLGSYMKDTDDINKFCFKAAIEDACDSGFQFAHFGLSYVEGMADFKGKFKFIRIPVRIYEKRYSMPRVFMELTQGLIDIGLHRTGYLWKQRKLILNRIVRS